MTRKTRKKLRKLERFVFRVLKYTAKIMKYV